MGNEIVNDVLGEELAELYNFQKSIEEEEDFCCPDGTEPFPNFSVDSDLLWRDEISPAELLNLTYGDFNIFEPKESYSFKEMIDARNEVANAFIKAFNINIKSNDSI